MGSALLTAAPSKGGALLSETLVLLRAWHEGETSIDFAERVREQGILARASARRTQDIVRRVFAPRYLAPLDAPARRMKRLLQRCGSGPWFGDLCLLHACRADTTLRAAVAEFLAEQAAAGALAVTTASVRDWLLEQQRAGRTASMWSAGVTVKIARGIVRSLCDFRLLESGAGRLSHLVPFRPSVLAAAYLAYDLHAAGVSDPAILEHRDWACWLQDRNQVRELLEDVAEQGLIILQVGGGVVRITWLYASPEEALDALAR